MTTMYSHIEPASLYKYCRRIAYLHDSCDLDMFEAQAELQGQIVMAARNNPLFLAFIHPAAEANGCNWNG
jgi:hypothetical protein